MEMYFCLYCPKIYQTSFHLIEHTKRRHPGRMVYVNINGVIIVCIKLPEEK